MLDIWP